MAIHDTYVHVCLFSKISHEFIVANVFLLYSVQKSPYKGISIKNKQIYFSQILVGPACVKSTYVCSKLA